MLLGLVADIQRFCVHDGPGIRSTAFLQGCTLRCSWCHNPECIPDRPQLRYRKNRCILCGACQDVCPQGVHSVSAQGHVLARQRCIACGKCTQVCPTESLILSSNEMTAQQAADELLEDLPYYQRSSGGVTLSGGEPLKQREFSLEVLRLCREKGAHTCLETALQVPTPALEASLSVTDLYLADFKMNEGLSKWTGGNSELIRQNLGLLCRSGAAVILRCPIIPGINDNDRHLEDIADIISSFPDILHVELMAYHKLALGKYEEIGKIYPLSGITPMSVEQKNGFIARAQRIIPIEVMWG